MNLIVIIRCSSIFLILQYWWAWICKITHQYYSNVACNSMQMTEYPIDILKKPTKKPRGNISTSRIKQTKCNCTHWRMLFLSSSYLPINRTNFSYRQKNHDSTFWIAISSKDSSRRYDQCTPTLKSIEILHVQQAIINISTIFFSKYKWNT